MIPMSSWGVLAGAMLGLSLLAFWLSRGEEADRGAALMRVAIYFALLAIVFLLVRVQG